MLKKCPNCGREVESNANFCTYCGYRFADNDQPTRTERRQHIYDNALNNDDQNDIDNYDGDSKDSHPNPPRKNHNKLVITLIIIAALLVIGGGVVAYKQVLTPGPLNNEPSSTSSHKSSSSSSTSASSSNDSSTSNSSSAQSTVSADDTNSIMNNVFSTVGASVSENGAYVDQVSDNFVNGANNDSYKNLSNWANAQANNNDIESVDMSVQNLTTTGNNADFQVKYVFHQPNGNPDHVQIFNWHAQMEQDSDGNLKIVSCTADNTPVSDYSE